MKPIFRIGLILVFLAGICGWPALKSQDNLMSDAARKFWLQNNPQHSGNGEFKFDRISRHGDLFIYERYCPASFVILMRSKEEIIPAGYSFQNLFFGDNAESTSQKEMLEAIEDAGKQDPGKLKGLKSISNNVGPLIQTKWGQGSYFNFYCPRDPTGPNGRVYVGCVAVAMGQILRYYGNFNSFDTQHSFQSGYYGTLSTRISTYKWAEMENSPVSISLETSDFLSDIGILLNTTYGPSGSTAISHRTLEAFHELGYINGILLRKSKFSPESWAEIFLQNLSDFKPVLVTGGGHAFVCDGFREDGFFHFNLGWDGYADGYYPLSAVMTMPVNEAFTELEPMSWPKPPKNITLKSSGTGGIISWTYEKDQSPKLSRVYTDDKLFMETADTIFDINTLGPGTHLVYVSAVYQDGESRWIGPVEPFVRGNLFTADDPALYQVIKKSLAKFALDTEIHDVYEGDLSRLISIEIDQPVINMKGISLCNHLKRLVIDGFPGLALDAGPLEDLTQLKILEWTGREMLHPEALEKMTGLSELRIRQTQLGSLEFLKGYHSLLALEYSNAQINSYQSIRGLPLLEELNLSHTGLADASFVSGLNELIRLDLSHNSLSESSFLTSLVNLESADISDNQLTKILLADGLKSINKLDVSDNRIRSINLTSELASLVELNLSGNQLNTPGRLFIYTPFLKVLDLCRNQIRTMGNQRCQNLEELDVSYNQLISTDWITCQPNLRKINLEHNLISDLSGLIRNNIFKQLDFLGLDKNPISRQSFHDWLPIIIEAVDSVSRPANYQPLSPCYVIPEDGSRLVGQEVELQWIADTARQSCVYDLFIVRGDTLAPLMQGLSSMKAVLSQRPRSAFSWVVASRTSDSTYYSGVNDVYSTSAWKLPFKDGFEDYREGEPLSDQSDYWFNADDDVPANQKARVVSTNSDEGLKSLEIVGKSSAVLSADHLEVPYLCIQFSVFVPAGQHGSFTVKNMNGISLMVVWDTSDIGRFYLNEELFNTFTVDHQRWMNYEILGHARNNSIYARAGNQILINEPWMVPEGIIHTESIEFSGQLDEYRDEASVNRFYVDELKITSTTVTTSELPEELSDNFFTAYPNPFSDYIHLSFSITGKYDLSVTDVTGKEVYHQRIEARGDSENTISLRGLPPGIYFIKPAGSEVKPIKIVRTSG